MKNRNSRLPVIVETLTHNHISSQEELSKQLATRGYIVTQATLSRDLKKLHATKIASDLGGYRYVVMDTAHLANHPAPAPRPTIQSALHPAVTQLEFSGNLMVLKTRNGYASGVAYDLDMLASDLILGTIPGADTVFAVIAEGTPRDRIIDLLTGFLPPDIISSAVENYL